MFASITCRPDITFPTIYLSQFSNHLAKCHYNAVKRIFKYLRSTLNHGIYYWIEKPLTILPDEPLLTVPNDTHNIKLPTLDFHFPYGFSDAYWATNPAT